MYYYTWGDQKLSEDIKQFFTTISALGITVSNLYNSILLFCKSNKEPESVNIFQWLEEYYLINC